MMVHPDITYPTTPKGAVPLDPKSIRKTRQSYYKLCTDLSAILGRKGHVLAIDTAHHLEWWADVVETFRSPIALVHSLNTGLLSLHQHSVKRLLKGLEDEISEVSELAEDVPIVVTWDASLNACVEGSDSTHDCTLTGQLWEAKDSEPGRGDGEDELNKLTENLFEDILKELKDADISGWFFRTAKIQGPQSTPNSFRSRKITERGYADNLISGNDYIALQQTGMLPNYKDKKGKNVILPAVIGIGAAAGAGVLGWYFWDDIKAVGNKVAQFFERPSESERAEIQTSAQVEVDSARVNVPIEVQSQAQSRSGSSHGSPQNRAEGTRTPTPARRRAPSPATRRLSSVHTIDTSKIPIRPVREMAEELQAPLAPLKPKSPVASPRERPQGVVSDAVSRIESHPESPVLSGSQVDSRRTSGLSQPLNLDQVRERVSGTDSEHVRPLSEIRAELERNGLQSPGEKSNENSRESAPPQTQEQTGDQPQVGPRRRIVRPDSGLRNIGSKRQGKVMSQDEQGLLSEMLRQSGIEIENEGESKAKVQAHLLNPPF